MLQVGMQVIPDKTKIIGRILGGNSGIKKEEKISEFNIEDKREKFRELTEGLVLPENPGETITYARTMAIATLERGMTSGEIYAALETHDTFPSYPAGFSEGMGFFREAKVSGVLMGTVAHLCLYLTDKKFHRWILMTSGYDKIWAEFLCPQKIFDPHWQIIAVKKEKLLKT